MDDRLQVGETELLRVDDTVVVRRPGARWFDSLFLLVFLILATPMLVGFFVLPVMMLWTFLKEGKVFMLLLAVAFGLGFLIVAWGYVVLQGTLFPFRAVVAQDRYRLANGLLRLSRRIRPETARITIVPVYGAGDWGYRADMKISGSRLSLPLVPPCITGTKYDALQEALKIRDWLRKNSPVTELTLEKWGNIEQIKPGED
jgi:hypothetical protein